MSIPETQREAWEAQKITNKERREQVFRAIESSPTGRTLFELVVALNWPINRISGRVTELHKRGVIRDSGRRRINPASGKSGIVWEPTPETTT